MSYALVGNNDGPLRLFKALQNASLPLPVFIGLQKMPGLNLLKEYNEHLESIPLATGFEENKLLELLAPYKPELLINCFCNFKFNHLLKLYRCVNVHPSYLPGYRGRHPLHWALINGEKSHGITVHEMSPSYDDGPILWQEKAALNENMSVAQLRELLMEKLEHNFPSIFTQIMAKKAKKRPNFTEKSTYFARRSPENSKLTEWQDAALIYRKIKALRSEDHPAFLPLENGQKIDIIEVKREDKREISNEKNLPVLIIVEKNALLIETADKQLLWLFSKEQLPHPIKIDFSL